MLKWLLAAAGAALLAALVLRQRDKVKTSYVNGLDAYSALPGRQFILERDCYVFKTAARDTDWPLIADHAAFPGLPPAVGSGAVGSAGAGVRILDLARAGARFRIVSVRRDESRKGASISFEILFLDEADRKYPRVDAFYLLDHGPEASGGAPGFLPAYAAPAPAA